MGKILDATVVATLLMCIIFLSGLMLCGIVFVFNYLFQMIEALS